MNHPASWSDGHDGCQLAKIQGLPLLCNIGMLPH
jgi:hypothetical protein